MQGIASQGHDFNFFQLPVSAWELRHPRAIAVGEIIRDHIGRMVMLSCEDQQKSGHDVKVLTVS